MWCIIYDIIYYIVIYCTTKGAIYVTGADPLFIATAAFITAMPNSYFIRKYIYKIFNKKNYDTLVALDEIENTQISNNIMNKAFQFLIALGLVFTVLLSNTNISFYDNYFKDNLDFFSLKGNNISYDDVKCIYKTDKIVNESGKVIALNTYTIALKDKTKVDLHMFLYYEDIKENIIPIFEQKQIEVRHIELFDNIDEDLKTAT